MAEEKKYYICEKCNKAWEAYSQARMHFMGAHPEMKPKPQQQEIEVDGLPEGYVPQPPLKPAQLPEIPSPGAVKQPPGSRTPPEPKTLYKQAGEPNTILRKVLSEYPSMEEPVVNEIMSWAEASGVLHPLQVEYLLKQMAGVPKGAAGIVSQKYQLLMQKAATEGNSDVQMAVAGWVQSPYGGATPSMGTPGMPMFQANTGMPGNYPGYQPSFIPQWQQPPWWLQNQPSPQAPVKTEADTRVDKLEQLVGELRNVIVGKEEDKRSAAVEERFGKLESTLDAITKLLTASEEQKREAVVTQKMDSLSEKLNQLTIEMTTKPQSNPESNKLMEELRAEITGLKNSVTQNQITRLEGEIKNLGTALSGAREDRIDKLETELEETKRKASTPVVGRTEMDVIASALDKGIDGLKEVGKEVSKNVSAIVTAPQTAARFNPLRMKPQDRAATGKQIAESVEKEAELTIAENAFIAPLGGTDAA